MSILPTICIYKLSVHNVHLCAKDGPFMSMNFVLGQENPFSAFQKDLALDPALESPETELCLHYICAGTKLTFGESLHTYMRTSLLKKAY